jgi:DNA (cytosine-5)-methyltransferase 1
VGLPSLKPNLQRQYLSPETFRLEAHGALTRSVARSDGSATRSTMGFVSFDVERWSRSSLAAVADLLWLRSVRASEVPLATRQIRVVDLFAGCGGLSLGLFEACRALNLGFAATAVDIDPAACALYERNIPNSTVFAADLSAMTRGRIDSRMTEFEKRLVGAATSPDILVAGPPCQGHSDLNNATRRRDPRNSLYFRVARIASLLKPAIILIENVVAVTHDRGSVVGRATRALEALGYVVNQEIVDLSALGVPQHRKRHVLLALLTPKRAITSPSPAQQIGSRGVLHDIMSRFAVPPRNLGWAIEDLSDVDGGFIDRAASPTERTQNRIDWLFENGAYDLPDRLRPPCHAKGNHSYRSVYGRLHFDRPAPTITGGFETMGRGRFVHPTRRRTLTAHEAARVQFFPDSFDWRIDDMARSRLAEIIGNAVPPKLSYVVGVDLLR